MTGLAQSISNSLQEAVSGPAANDVGTVMWTAPEAAHWSVLHDSIPCEGDDLVVALAPTISGVVVDASARTCPRPPPRDERGVIYPGDLWRDIFEYRGLRMSALSGTDLDDAQRERLNELDKRLCASSDRQARQFARFSCNHTAYLRATTQDNRTWVAPIKIINVSAGGVKIECELSLLEGELVALLVESDAGDSCASVISRVIWTKPGAAGLMFAGAPRWG